MEQLSRLQHNLLACESEGMPMHLSSLAIYDASTTVGGGPAFAAIRQFLSERIHRAKLFGRRLATPPLGLTRPYWFDDAAFDIEYHVRRIALPKPGDWRQLATQVARLHARPLDRARPLWECYVIEGLTAIPGRASGSFALYMKLHRATLDDALSADLFAALHELRPDGHASQPKRPRRLESAPTATRLALRAIADVAWQPLLLAGSALRHAHPLLSGTMMRAGALGRRAMHGGGGSHAEAGRVALPARFNGDVSARRVLEGVRFPLAQVERIRAVVPHATADDVAVTVIGGAMRRYLGAKEEPPVGNLVAEAPVDHASRVRAPGRSALAEAALVSLHTTVHDPVHRLRLVAHDTARTGSGGGLRGRQLLRVAVDLVPAKARRAARECARRVGTALRTPALHTRIAAVRGPDVPLYLAGARLADYYGFAPLDHGVGLTHVVARYHDHLTIGVTACRTMLPDPAFYAGCLRSSFAELLLDAGKTSRNVRAIRRKSPGRPPEVRLHASLAKRATHTPAAGAVKPRAGRRSPSRTHDAAGRISRDGRGAE